jgi:hypothetical protein
VLLLNECLLFISLSTQSGNFWIHSRKTDKVNSNFIDFSSHNRTNESFVLMNRTAAEHSNWVKQLTLSVPFFHIQEMCSYFTDFNSIAEPKAI